MGVETNQVGLLIVLVVLLPLTPDTPLVERLERTDDGFTLAIIVHQ